MVLRKFVLPVISLWCQSNFTFRHEELCLSMGFMFLQQVLHKSFFYIDLTFVSGDTYKKKKFNCGHTWAHIHKSLSALTSQASVRILTYA